MGKMISPQNLAIGAAAVGLTGKEGDIFRNVIGWSIFFVLIMAVFVWLNPRACCPGWCLSGPRRKYGRIRGAPGGAALCPRILT